MDIKLSIDGDITLIDGDFTTTVDMEELKLNINKIIRGWVGNYNIAAYIGKRNTKVVARSMKRQLDLVLSKYYPFLSTRIVPTDAHSIAIFIGIPSSDTTIYQTIFNYENGSIQYMENVEQVKYKDAINQYILK